MAQTKVPSTRSLPFFFPSFAVLSLVLFLLAFYYENAIKKDKPDYVKWVPMQQALEKSKDSNKAILYDFSAEWCPPCRQMQKEVFGDRKIAKWINSTYIPVKVVDRSREEGVRDVFVKTLQKKYDIDGFPTLVVALPTKSKFEKRVGYGGKERTVGFLKKCFSNFIVENLSFAVNWKKLDEVVNDESDKKPLLLFFGNNKLGSSKYDYFQDEDLISLVNKEFTPVAIDMPLAKNKFKVLESSKLIESLEVERVPTLVLLSQTENNPHYHIGTADPADTLDFIEKFLAFDPAK